MTLRHEAFTEGATSVAATRYEDAHGASLPRPCGVSPGTRRASGGKFMRLA